MNDYFTHSPLAAHTVARAADINSRTAAIEAGFDLLPPPIYLYEDRLTYSVDTGAANAYVATPDVPILAYTEGLRIRLKATNANTGVSTLNVSGLGVKEIVRADGSALQAGDIVSGQIMDLTYNGTKFVLAMAFAEVSPAGVAAKLQAAGAVTTTGLTTVYSLRQNGQTIDALTSFGVSLVEAAAASDVRTLIGLAGDLPTIAGLATTAYGRALLTLADAAALTALPNVFTSLLKGLVPASGGGTTNFLRADGSFADPLAGLTIGSGTYAPVIHSQVDITAPLTFSNIHYMRIGNTVTLGGKVVINAATAADSYAVISVPINSAFTNDSQASGTGLTHDREDSYFVVEADAANRIKIKVRAGSAGALTYRFNATYQIL
jgi:hypothetical protein